MKKRFKKNGNIKIKEGFDHLVMVNPEFEVVSTKLDKEGVFFIGVDYHYKHEKRNKLTHIEHEIKIESLGKKEGVLVEKLFEMLHDKVMELSAHKNSEKL